MVGACVLPTPSRLTAAPGLAGAMHRGMKVQSLRALCGQRDYIRFIPKSGEEERAEVRGARHGR
jgi:hypothetical protein